MNDNNNKNNNRQPYKNKFYHKKNGIITKIRKMKLI